MKRLRYFLPLVIVVALGALLAAGLRLNPREVPSPLIDKPAPAFTLPRLDQPAAQISRADMQGRVWLLNVWASWCEVCRDEHPELIALSKMNVVPIVGLNYKDERQDGLRWLGHFGNPYMASVYDHEGQVGIDYGVYGVPETFVIDKHGTIRYKQIGALTDQSIRDTIVPLVKKLQGDA